MTRINVVPPSELSGKHLVAEYRELPRIYKLVSKAINRGEAPDDKRNPLEYTLGTGHCRFFYPRIGFIMDRDKQLYFEMLERGYKPNFKYREHKDILELGVESAWHGDYIPTNEALEINRKRIAERS